MREAALHLVRTLVDLVALRAFAARQDVRDDDLGYALHLALRRRYGAVAPQPWRLVPGRDRPRDVLLGYTADLDALHAGDPRRAGVAPPEPLPDWDGDWGMDGDLAGIFPATFEAKRMPAAWPAGARYGFEARLRPVVRYGARALAVRKAEGRLGETERDAFLAAIEQRDAAGGSPEAEPRDRRSVYRIWLERRLRPAATLGTMRLVSHRRIRIVRALKPEAGRACLRRFEGPETVVDGELEVAEPAAFAALIARGVGRHAAFGFGMLLLKAVGR